MKIATTTDDLFLYLPEDDVIQAMHLLNSCGFRYLDLCLDAADKPGLALQSDNWEDWADAIREASLKAGVDFVQSHGSGGPMPGADDYGPRMDMLRRQLKVCEKIGIPGMVVHAAFKSGMTREEFLQANTLFYSDLLKTCEETGVAVYTENTCESICPDYFLFTGSDFNALRERLKAHPLFGCCWDVGHANIQHDDQYRSIMTMGDGLKAVHIHDNNGQMDLHIQPFSGCTCYDAILKGLIDVGYKGAFTLEAYSIPTPSSFYFCQRKPFVLDGKTYNKLSMLPIELKMRSEMLMLDVAKYMLKTYDIPIDD